MHLNIPGDWILHRREFKFGGAKKLCEAQVDGYLSLRENDEVRVIMEVKPCIREGRHEKIGIQEAAELAARISQFPPGRL